ncbi:MAG: cysteine desulfurase family protein [Candidatus Woesearchaeota archaeon]
MRFKEIYLDNGATTKLDPRVLKAMAPYFTEKYGNASSTHSFGQDSKDALEKSRGIIARSINAMPEEIVFTSGGTESNNFALKGMAFGNKGKHIVTTKAEHKCILNSCKWLESLGFKITYLDVDSEGFLDIEVLDKAITEDTVLVSVIHGNNEIGTIQNLKELGEICHSHNVPFHTDACQSYTKAELDVKKQNLNLISLNAHKIHGPKGVGALYIKEGTKISSWQHGGGQEKGMRSGTENIQGIVGFAEAVRLGMNKSHIAYMTKLRDSLIAGLEEISDAKLNGPRGEKRLCNNVNFSFKHLEGSTLGGYLDQNWVCSSTGSACSARSSELSYVLKAIGLSDEEANGSIRLTLSRFNTEDEINHVLKVMPKLVKNLRTPSMVKKIVAMFKKKSE